MVKKTLLCVLTATAFSATAPGPAACPPPPVTPAPVTAPSPITPPKAQVKALTDMFESVADKDNPLYDSFAKTFGSLIEDLKKPEQKDPADVKKDAVKMIDKLDVFSKAYNNGFDEEDIPAILAEAKQKTEANLAAATAAKKKGSSPACVKKQA